VEKDVLYCPTLVVGDGYHQVDSREPSEQVMKQELPCVCCSIRHRVMETRKLPPRYSEEDLKRYAKYGEKRQSVMQKNLKLAHDAGVKVTMGTDAGNPLTLHGPSVFKEMERMQEAGLSPLAVLEAATKNGAAALREPTLGQVKTGFLADIIVTSQDPAENIAALRQVQYVVKRGYLHTREKLLYTLENLP